MINVIFIIKKNLWGKPVNQFRAVDNVDLELFEGETLGVVGESGSGKTTLMHILYVPHTAAPRVGDLLACSGQGSRFPAGLAVARVTAVSCGDIMYDIEAEPLVCPIVGQVGMLMAPVVDERVV